MEDGCRDTKRSLSQKDPQIFQRYTQSNHDFRGEVLDQFDDIIRYQRQVANQIREERGVNERIIADGGYIKDLLWVSGAFSNALRVAHTFDSRKLTLFPSEMFPTIKPIDVRGIIW